MERLTIEPVDYRSAAARRDARHVNPCGSGFDVRLEVDRREKIGKAVGLTFQQIQKYERGASRISASRIWAFSHVLDVPVPFFFEEMPPEISGKSVPNIGEDKKQGSDPLAKRETLELVRAHYQIKSPNVRKQLFKLVKCLPDA